MPISKKRGLDNTAGFDLIKHIKEGLPNLPSVLQSSDPEMQNTHTPWIKFLLIEILKACCRILNRLSILSRLWPLCLPRHQRPSDSGSKIDERVWELSTDYTWRFTCLSFYEKPFLTLAYGKGRGENCQNNKSIMVSDFNSLKELREFLLDIIRKRRREMNKGKVVNFEESAVIDETNVVSFSGGSLGGKGRGLAFVNTLIYSLSLVVFARYQYQNANHRNNWYRWIWYLMERNQFVDKVKEEKNFEFFNVSFLKELWLHSRKKLRILSDSK